MPKIENRPNYSCIFFSFSFCPAILILLGFGVVSRWLRCRRLMAAGWRSHSSHRVVKRSLHLFQVQQQKLGFTCSRVLLMSKLSQTILTSPTTSPIECDSVSVWKLQEENNALSKLGGFLVQNLKCENEMSVWWNIISVRNKRNVKEKFGKQHNHKAHTRLPVWNQAALPEPNHVGFVSTFRRAGCDLLCVKCASCLWIRHKRNVGMRWMRNGINGIVALCT